MDKKCIEKTGDEKKIYGEGVGLKDRKRDNERQRGEG